MTTKTRTKPPPRGKQNGGSTLGGRILMMLEQRGMSQHDLAKAAQMSQQSVNYLVNPDAGDPVSKRSERVVEMAVALNCDPIWLATGKGQPFAGATTTGSVATTTHRVPLINVDQIESYLNLSRRGSQSVLMKDGLLARYAHSDTKVGQHAFAVRVWDDCMEPVAKPGDVVIVDPDMQEGAGEVVVAKIEPKGSLVLRTYKPLSVRHGKEVYDLVPRNPGHSSISSADTKVKLLGVVVEGHIYCRSVLAQQYP